MSVLDSLPELEHFLREALAAAEALTRLHQSGIIHGNIRPETLRFAPRGTSVELVGARSGFGPAPSSIELPLESLPYIAPEQTGRFEGQIDHRVDLYSLGMVLYERLAKTLPFHADDHLGWVHCHVARAPRPLTDAAAGTPQILSDVVMKLLAKSPDERYRSARGLAFDLERCLLELRAKGRIEPFQLGTRDVWDKLRAAPRMYGRDAELVLLGEAAVRAWAGGKVEAALVAGPSGIGKTALVRELQKRIGERTFFLWGKFEPYKRDIPYAMIGQAFGDLARQLLAMPDNELDGVRRRLESALGVNARLIVELVPPMELVIGKQPPVAPLPAADAKSRFNMTFATFLGVLATAERPIVLFLDDMQWADFGSLDLFQHVLTQPGLGHVLLLGAHRDDEVGPTHPLRVMLAAAEGAGAKITSIAIGPLAQSHVVELVLDLFGCERAEAEPLAALLWTKTGGNPFFLAQLLGELHEAGLIKFDARRWAWRWSIADIEAKEITEDLVALVLGKLQRLPAETLEILKSAACIGDEFTIDILATLWAKSSDELRPALEPALVEGILLPRPNGYKFLHDKLVQAVYSLMPEDERTALHLRFGWLLLEGTREEELGGVIFDVVNQLNLGAARVTAPEDRRRIAELDLQAGRRAKASAAAKTAIRYLTKGVSLLPWDGWGADYALAYGLHLELAECQFLSGRFEEADGLCTLLVHRARTRVDRSAAYRLQIQLATVQVNNARALDLGRTCLSMLGVELSANPSAADLDGEIAWVRRKLEGRAIEDLRDLPEMTDPETIAAMESLATLTVPAVYVSPVLNHLLIARMVRLSILHGNAPPSVQGYVLFGQILCSRNGDFRDGYRFGKLACELCKKPRFDAYNTEALGMFGAMISVWSRPMRDASAILQEGARIGFDSGKMNFASASQIQGLFLELAMGSPLDSVRESSASAFEMATNARLVYLAEQVVGLERVILSLRGSTERFGSMNGDGFDEATFEDHLQDRNVPLVRFHHNIYKLMLRYLAHDDAGAAAAAAVAKDLLWSRLYTVADVELFFFGALAAAALYEGASKAERARLRAELSSCEEQLRVWAEHCPENFLCRHALVGAEIARVEGREHDAAVLYDKAIRTARDGGFVHILGIACELAARYYLRGDWVLLPAACMREARASYLRWGALGKVRQLDSLHADLLAEPGREAPASPELAAETLATKKANEAITSDMAPDKLLEEMMRIVVEHAGAQRACLLLPTAEGLQMAAEARALYNGVHVEIAQTGRSPSPTDFPLSIAHYVRRTREKLLLDDGMAEVRFPADPYISASRPRSLLCAPIVESGEVAGILYLENSLAHGAFTARRMALVEFLSTVSLENARLAAAVAREAEARTAVEETLRQKEEALKKLAEGVDPDEDPADKPEDEDL
jgi:predicted ATPase